METQQNLGPYVLVKHLGSGTTGKVKLAIHKESQNQYAIKIIRKEDFQDRPNLQTKIQREIALMRLVDHPHILKLVDFLESPRHLYIVLEYASKGELFDYLVEKKTLPEDVAIRFFRQIIYGLEYLHSLGICHRDLKPENILLDESLNVKIADFGFARFVKTNIAETSCGSPHYAAPEVIRGQPYDGRAADIWSCGVILYALLAGHLPFDDSSVRNLLMKVKRGIYTMPPFSEEAQSLISRLLTLDPTKRITISEIKQHPFFRESIPNDYITPTPIPFPNLIQPIDPSTVTPEIVDILRKIGYNDDAELAVDLASPLHTMAKVFYYMLTTRLSFDQLDWSIAIDLSIGSQHENPMNDSTSPEIMMDPAHTAFGLSGSDPFHRHANSDHSSTSFDNINSIANTVDWNVPETSPMKCEQTFQATLNGIEITQLMRLMQILVTQFKMKWFFPDDFTMICISDVVGGYIIIQSQCLNSEIDVLLTMQLFDGNTEAFAGVCKAVEEMFQGNTSF